MQRKSIATGDAAGALTPGLLSQETNPRKQCNIIEHVVSRRVQMLFAHPALEPLIEERLTTQVSLDHNTLCKEEQLTLIA